MLERFGKELMRKKLVLTKDSPYNIAVIGPKIDHFVSLPPRICALRLFHQIRNESTQYEALKRVLKKDPQLSPTSNKEYQKTLEFPRFGQTDLTLENTPSQQTKAVEAFLSKPTNNSPITCSFDSLKFRESFAQKKAEAPQPGRRSLHSLPGNWCFRPDLQLQTDPQFSKNLEISGALLKGSRISFQQTRSQVSEKGFVTSEEKSQLRNSTSTILEPKSQNTEGVSLKSDPSNDEDLDLKSQNVKEAYLLEPECHNTEGGTLEDRSQNTEAPFLELELYTEEEGALKVEPSDVILNADCSFEDDVQETSQNCGTNCVISDADSSKMGNSFISSKEVCISHEAVYNTSETTHQDCGHHSKVSKTREPEPLMIAGNEPHSVKRASHESVHESRNLENVETPELKPNYSKIFNLDDKDLPPHICPLEVNRIRCPKHMPQPQAGPYSLSKEPILTRGFLKTKRDADRFKKVHTILKGQTRKCFEKSTGER